MQQFYSKNANLIIYVNGELLPRKEAKISVFDSVVQGGDAVWEGLRVYNGKIFCLDRHLERLQNSAHAMVFENVPSNDEIKNAIRATLKANDMTDGVHIRLTLTRGEKTTSGMDPRLNQFGCGLIVLAEWKPPVYDQGGIALITSSIRRNSPQCIDSKIHHNNLINNILAKIEANLVGAAAGIMLDLNGFVSEANGTNIFMVRNGHLYTPSADFCLPGITRGVVLEIAKELGIPHTVRNLSVSEFHIADEVFVTGTMGELTPVLSIDGREIRQIEARPVMRRLQTRFAEWTAEKGEQMV